MKKILAIVMLLLLVGSWPVAAKEKLTTENKISADSPFYFMDRTGEKISYFFAGKKKKVKLKFLYAYERLIETKELLEKEKVDKANKLFKKAVNEFSEGVKLAAKYTVEDQDLEEIREEVKYMLNELKKLMAEKNLQKITNDIKSIFND